MSDSNSLDGPPPGPYELHWNIPPAPLYSKEPGGVVLRVTYKSYITPRVGTYTTFVKLPAQAQAYFGRRKGSVQHRLCELHFRGQVPRTQAEPFVLPMIDICSIRFGLTIRKVDWWGVNGERKGKDEVSE
jgi:hypothetical protein